MSLRTVLAIRPRSVVFGRAQERARTRVAAAFGTFSTRPLFARVGTESARVGHVDLDVPGRCPSGAQESRALDRVHVRVQVVPRDLVGVGGFDREGSDAGRWIGEVVALRVRKGRTRKRHEAVDVGTSREDVETLKHWSLSLSFPSLFLIDHAHGDNVCPSRSLKDVRLAHVVVPSSPIACDVVVLAVVVGGRKPPLGRDFRPASCEPPRQGAVLGSASR